ncbi:hypothetical protein [Lentzea aerocolonigenes]|uniref:hypothetical protein n=1 Tax=Lentzea aerocolonigenes TaxID=68170 RepID=UPI00191BE185|nr:hypothetical protein [Lentzea aerocolonigenes]MCP2244427.1 hypothetical protein [Lentzea aerocolonigenes]
MRVLAMATAVLVAVSTTLVSTLPAHAATISRADMIARAKTWLTADNGKPVPYSQTSYWGAEGYRQDCSGYVSMAAKIGAPGQRTVELYDTYSTRIAAADMRWGDIVVDPVGTGTTRHVVIFDKWADPYKSAYWAYEQRDVYGTTYRVLKYGLSGTDGYFPRKLNNVTG